MIFFGTKGKTVSGQLIEGIQCPSCENQQFVTFGVIRYFHLYWIPTVPTSKVIGMECTHCKKTLVDKEVPPEIAQTIKTTLFDNKKIIPLFSGLIIIACLMLFGFYSAYQGNIDDAAYIEQPAVHDLYLVDFSKIYTDIDPVYKYGVMRIRYVSGNEVEFEASTIAYNKKSGVRADIRNRKTSADSYYDTELLYLTIEELKGLKASGAIDSIERN